MIPLACLYACVCGCLFRLLDVLEVVAPFKQFQRLRDFITSQLPPGFPVCVGQCRFLQFIDVVLFVKCVILERWYKEEISEIYTGILTTTILLLLNLNWKNIYFELKLNKFRIKCNFLGNVFISNTTHVHVCGILSETFGGKCCSLWNFDCVDYCYYHCLICVEKRFLISNKVS